MADVPHQLIGDKAYDSDRLDEQLMQEYGTELIAPTSEPPPTPKTVGACDATAVVGRSNGSSLGCSTSDGWLCATNIMRRTSKVSFTLARHRYPLEAFMRWLLSSLSPFRICRQSHRFLMLGVVRELGVAKRVEGTGRDDTMLVSETERPARGGSPGRCWGR